MSTPEDALSQVHHLATDILKNDAWREHWEDDYAGGSNTRAKLKLIIELCGQSETPEPRQQLMVLSDVERHTGVICSSVETGADGKPDSRVNVKQWQDNDNLITIGMFMGNHRWIEGNFTPEDAAKVAAVILNKPAVAALRTPAPQTSLLGSEAAIRKAGQVAIDAVIDGWTDRECFPTDDDLADYLTRIVDACVRAALAATATEDSR